MTRKVRPPRPSVRLWGAIRIWAILFMLLAAVSMSAFAWRIWLLNLVPSDVYMTEMSYISDYVPGAEAEMWTTGVAALLYIIAYVVAGFLILMWFLRSIRNARALSIGVETSPAWVIWWFFIPVVSLWKPYGMASELWRSSEAPDQWKGLPDPALLRWWWGAVLLSGIVIGASSMLARTAQTAGQIVISDSVLIAGYALQIIAGVLFLRIGGPISKRQTSLIAQGRIAPPPSQPGWAA